jgi:alpha-beta hydrolase superfamily lysophospholipase
MSIMTWYGIVLVALATPPALVVLFLLYLWIHLRIYYAHYLVRIFQEKPLFIVPRGQPVPGAEDVRFPTSDGLSLVGAYLKTPASRRRGVILFGLEFGCNRWACGLYCEHLLEAGFDVFTFDPRGQGDSPVQPGYEPLQWVTDHDQCDVEAAIAYLKNRPDADARGIGLFGISKGGCTALQVMAQDPWILCAVTDGIYGTRTTVVPYMRKWIHIYSKRSWLNEVVPTWYYRLKAQTIIRRMAKSRHCHFIDLEPAMKRLAPRPLLMIHGGADAYIKPEMAEELFALAREPKSLWMVPGAKHNQAIQLQGDEYRRRVLEFFEAHLAATPTTPSLVRKNEAAPAPTVAS